MGRLDSSRKGNVARKRRLQELSEEFEADRALRVEESLDAAKPDEELFFVDTSAATSLPLTKSKAEKRRRFFSEKVSCVAMPSVHLVKAVERIVKGQQQSGKTGGEGKTGTSAAATEKPTKPTPRTKSATKKEEEDIYDIWGAETGGAKGGKGGKGKKGKKAGPAPVPKSKLRVLKAPLASLVPLIEKPLGGQSYHPSAEKHQEALLAAVAVEEKRDAALAKMKAPLAVMSEATKALLLSDSEEDDGGEDGEEEEEEQEEGGEGGAVETKRMLRRKGKMTKAERNKQRRRKAMEHQAVLDKEQKALSQQASRAREHAKALRRQDKAVKKEKKNISGNSRNKPFAPLDLPTVQVVLPQDKNPLRARSMAVPLSDELGGSLRALRTKGSLASETLEGLQRRGQYEIVPQRKSARPRERVKYVQKFRGE